MSDVLNFDQPFNATTFDTLVSSALDKFSPAHKESDLLLYKFKTSPESYIRIEPIFNECKMVESHMIALQIFEELIKTKFYTFNDEQKNNFRIFLYSLILKKTESHDIALPKYNQVFISLIKREWPHKQQNIIEELITTAQTISIPCCMNTFKLLKILVEEIFFCYNPETKFRKYVQRLRQDNESILGMVFMVLEKGKGMDESLVESAFVFLATYVKYFYEKKERRQGLSGTRAAESTAFNAPHASNYNTGAAESTAFNAPRPSNYNTTPCDTNFVFSDENLRLLTSYLNTKHTISVLKVLYEINRIKDSEFIGNEFFEFLKMYFSKFSSDNNFVKIFKREYLRMTPSEKEFLLQSAYLLTTMKHDSGPGDSAPASLATFHGFIMAFQQLPNLSIFKLLLDKMPPCNKTFTILISRMPRPIEVLIVENEDGEIVREKVEGTENLEFGKMMGYRAWRFAHDNPAYAKSHVMQTLEGLYSGESEFESEDHDDFGATRSGLGGRGRGRAPRTSNYGRESRSTHGHDDARNTLNTNLLNKVCWTVGAIQGALPSAEEDSFYVEILKDLLTLCENRQKKEDKAIIASNIMYVVGKYYKFLTNNRNFLKTVIKKLFEFMKEEYEGVKDMACDTLLMICEKVRLADVSEPFVTELVERINDFTRLLENYQKRVVYRSIALLLRDRQDLIERFSAVLKNRDFDTREICNYAKTQQIFLSYFKSEREARFILEFYCDEPAVMGEILDFFSVYFLRGEVNCAFVKFFVDLGSVDFRNLNVVSAVMANLNGEAECEESSGEEGPRADGSRVNGNTGSITGRDQLSSSINSRDQLSSSITDRQLSGTFTDRQLTHLPSGESASSYIESLMNSALQIILASLKKLRSSDDFTYAYYNLIEKSLNIIFLNKILMVEEVIESVYTGLSLHSRISRKCMRILRKMFSLCESNNFSVFVEKNVDKALENLLGIILDKEKDCIFRESAKLLHRLLRLKVAQEKMSFLLSSFDNMSEEYKMLFLRGMVEIENDALFDHVRDFRIRAVEYFDKEDYEDEVLLVNERIGSAR